LSPESGRQEPADLYKALEESAGQADWVPIFTDSFERTSVGEDWKIVNGEARISNGWMRVTATRRSDLYAVIRRPFPDAIRVEFDARFPSGLTEVSDLGCFLAGDEHRCDQAGYCLSFGADANTCSRIQRYAIDVRLSTEPLAEVGRTYHIAAEMQEGNLTLAVDGEVLLRYLDMVPLAGVGHDRMGLVSFSYGAEFANVKVLTRSGPSHLGPFTVADAYCRDGLFDQAIERYRQVAVAHPGQPLSLLAQCKVGLALFAAGRWSEAEAQMRGLAGPAKGTDLEHLVVLWHGRALGIMGKLDDAFRAFGRVQSATKDPGMVDETAVACGLLSQELRRESRWLESGLCAKFLFENLKTPLIQTSHMFGRYGRMLTDAALYEEEYQTVKKLGASVLEGRADPGMLAGIMQREASSAVMTGRIDRALEIYDELEKKARSEGNHDRELGVLARRVGLHLSLGEYEKALERVVPFAGTPEEEEDYGETQWGVSLADLRAAATILLGRMDEALEDLDAGRINSKAFTLRMILAAELRRRGREAASSACMSELQENFSPIWGRKLMEKAIPATRGELLTEPFREFVDTVLQPAMQPLGLFLVGLALWAGGDEGAATLPWSDATNSALEVMPAWHWTNYFQGRVES